MIVAIVDYGSGNLRSAAKAFERAAAENEISAAVEVTSVPEAVAGAASLPSQVSKPRCMKRSSSVLARFSAFASACS